jgi:hypothetical protein
MKTVKIKKMIAAFLCVFAAVGALPAAELPFTASAAEYEYSAVLDDLKKDTEFRSSDYPVDNSDYSLQVIQIAESRDGELFVYVYQPSHKTWSIEGTSINISTALHDSLKYQNYTLKLLDSKGVFYKYRVEDLKVKTDTVRYYDISAIYRAWHAGIDKITTGATAEGNTVSEVPYAVGQLWTASTASGEVTYTVEDVETIQVTSKMVGFRRYNDGFQWQGTKSCDAHYLAFSTKREIDRLISADVGFYTQTYKTMAGQSPKYGVKEKQFVTLYHEKVDNEGNGWGGEHYIWDRLSSVTEYIADIEKQGKTIPAAEKKELLNYQWIINFYETDYEVQAGQKDILITLLMPGGFIWSIVNSCTSTGTLVSDVSLMRLEFESDNKVYNLGVVDHKQTGSKNPTNDRETFWEWMNKKTGIPIWGLKILVPIVGILLLILFIKLISLFSPVFKALVNLIVNAVGVFVKNLIYVLSLPIRGIRNLITRRREGKEEEPQKPEARRNRGRNEKMQS